MYLPEPSSAARTHWLGFCEDLGVFGSQVDRRGVFLPHIKRSAIDQLLETYVNAMIFLKGVLPSAIEDLYGGPVRINRIWGRPVKGSQPARSIVNAYKKTHQKKERVVASERQLLAILHEITSMVFGKPGRRKKYENIDKDDLTKYFFLTNRAAVNTRGATMLPTSVKESHTEKALAECFVFERDLVIGYDHISLTTYMKQTKLRGSLDATTTEYPQSKTEYSKLKYICPYWTAVILDTVLTEQEKEKLLRITVGKKKKFRRPMITTDLNAWLVDLTERSPRIRGIIAAIPEYKLNPSTLRAQFTTIYQRTSNSADELMKLSRHSSAATALEHYSKMSRDEITDLRHRCLDRFNTEPMHFRG